jgi:hypothetical protein
LSERGVGERRKKKGKEFLKLLILFYKRPNGVMFEVPASDVLIPTPSIGSVVTFCYESYSRKEVPLNPIITRIRADISWEEVMRGSVREKTTAKCM